MGISVFLLMTIVENDKPNIFMKMITTLALMLWTIISVSASDLKLTTKEADIVGDGAVYEPHNLCVGSWEDEETVVKWQIKVKKAGTVKIICNQAAMKRSEGNRYQVIIANSEVTGQVIDTGGWDRFQSVELGQIIIPEPGIYSVVVRSLPKRTLAVMNLRSISLIGDHYFDAEVMVPKHKQRGIYFAKK